MTEALPEPGVALTRRAHVGDAPPIAADLDLGVEAIDAQRAARLRQRAAEQAVIQAGAERADEDCAEAGAP